MNTMDIQLTYTADGRTYHRAGNRKPILKVFHCPTDAICADPTLQLQL